MPDIEPFHQDTQHLLSGNPEHLGASKVTTIGTNPNMEKAPNDRGDQRGDERSHSQQKPQHQPRQHSMITIILIAACVSLVSGVVGAMAYAHYLAPSSGESSSSRSQGKSGAKSESGSAKSSGDADQKSGAETSTTEMSPEPETGDLKQQIANLNKRIERLGERVDRLQELLSLAVPLLQRIAPKHQP